MKAMPFATLLLSLLLAGPAAAGSDVTDPDAPLALPGQGPVDVRWTDPAQFSELRHSGNRSEARRGDWVRQLAEYLREEAAPRLAPGQRLSVTLTDVERAGDYEPWRGIDADRVRFMRDIYPPRIALDFTLTGADGQVLAQGTRKLSDTAYLQRGSRLGDSDPLRYEKRLLDDWLRREFAAPRD